MKLSQKALELLSFFKKEYVDDGYMYSGSLPYTSLKENGFDKDVIKELQDAGKIQRRNCEEYAFELSPAERGNLITDHSLCSVWYEKTGPALLLSIQNEIRDVADVVASGPDQGKDMVTVRTMKAQHSDDLPDRMQVPCSFSVGQVLNLEYDLPRKSQWTGYLVNKTSQGKALGQFMVTDVIHNLMVQPSMNLLEVQSLCYEFNKLYPRERTMMVFEDVLQNRTISAVPSLNDHIESAEDLSDHGQTKEEFALGVIEDAIKSNVLMEGPAGGVLVYKAFDDGREGWTEVSREEAARDLAEQDEIQTLLDAINNSKKRPLGDQIQSAASRSTENKSQHSPEMASEVTR